MPHCSGRSTCPAPASRGSEWAARGCCNVCPEGPVSPRPACGCCGAGGSDQGQRGGTSQSRRPPQGQPGQHRQQPGRHREQPGQHREQPEQRRSPLSPVAERGRTAAQGRAAAAAGPGPRPTSGRGRPAAPLPPPRGPRGRGALRRAPPLPRSEPPSAPPPPAGASPAAVATDTLRGSLRDLAAKR